MEKPIPIIAALIIIIAVAFFILQPPAEVPEPVPQSEPEPQPEPTVNETTEENITVTPEPEPEPETEPETEPEPEPEPQLQPEEPGIWQPEPGLTWQWQLSGTVKTNYDVDVYDIDLFDTPKSTIESLQNKGIKVICYFSAGSWEDWRDDADDFPKSVLGSNLEGWAGEKWLDVSEYEKFADIMEARLDLAVTKGCDAVEPDNVDGYQNGQWRRPHIK